PPPAPHSLGGPWIGGFKNPDEHRKERFIEGDFDRESAPLHPDQDRALSLRGGTSGEEHVEFQILEGSNVYRFLGEIDASGSLRGAVTHANRRGSFDLIHTLPTAEGVLNAKFGGTYSDGQNRFYVRGKKKLLIFDEKTGE